MTTLEVKLSPSSIKDAKERIQKYRNSLPNKLDDFCERLCEEGVEAAIQEVKVASGELQSGISFRSEGTHDYCVVSDGYYAAFVEFGTGVVGELDHAFEPPPEAGWKYDTLGTPEAHDPDDPTTWYYYDENNQRFSTQGQRGEGYMGKAALTMRFRVQEIAKEVFNFD